MVWGERRKRFRELVEGTECIHPASVFDPISARIAEDLNFKIGMFAGSVASMTVLGSPDLVIITLSEFAGQTYRICRASDLPLLVDADHGYGNALSVRRTVQELEASGIAALTIEDTKLPQSYGSPRSVELLSLDESVGKMRAALEARKDNKLIVAARTSAFNSKDNKDAILRAIKYQDAGVDAVFFTGISENSQIEMLTSSIKIPIFISPQSSYLIDRSYLSRKGVRICLQGHQPFAAAIQAVYTTLKALKDGTPPSKIGALASDNLMKNVTRDDLFNRLIKEYLSE